MFRESVFVTLELTDEEIAAVSGGSRAYTPRSAISVGSAQAEAWGHQVSVGTQVILVADASGHPAYALSQTVAAASAVS